jgi:RNA polymerase sigma-70 factor (ECF subfamily)
VTDSVEETLRVEGGQVLATLIRLTGDIDVAEDALQEAALVALEKWRHAGVPDNPGAWLTTVARHKALDHLRREGRRRDKENEAAITMLDSAAERPDPDDRLRLIFTCCHPSLSPETRVILTLRTIGGLSTPEIARAFLMPDATIGQRISRAKKKISVAAIPYRLPPDHELPDRLSAVLATLYVIFTTGHHSFTGRLDSRIDLAEEAIRLGRVLTTLMPDEHEVHGLLALMLATHARRRSRLDRNGDLVLLAEQDRRLWDRSAITEASALVERSLRRHRPGPYQIQAAIACLHGDADSDAHTDWKQIVDLYRALERVAPGPVVRVNRAVAEAKVFGATAGLALLEDVSGVGAWHLYWSTQAELMRQLGRTSEAGEAYRRALDCEMNDSDRRFLEGRLESLR